MGQVLTWCQQMLKGGTAFGTATQPTLTQVEQLINGRVADVSTALARSGYATAQPVATSGTRVCTVISQAIAFGVVADIELTKPTAGGNLKENTRYVAFSKRWEDFLAGVNGAALQYMGAVRERDASNGMKVTGTSYAEREADARNPDLVQSLFPRGWMDNDLQRDHLPQTDDYPIVHP